MKIGVMQSSYIDLFNMPICLHRKIQKIISREKERDQGKWIELRFRCGWKRKCNHSI